MGDDVQVVIVTAVAAASLVALIRPYLRKPGARSAPPCANCVASRSAMPRVVRLARTASASTRTLDT